MTTPADSFYRTPARRRLRAARLRIDRHTCTVPGCGNCASCVDHIISRRAGGADTLMNLRSLCRQHDNQAKEDAHGKRRTGGRFFVTECNADGSPRDPNHPWYSASKSTKRCGAQKWRTNGRPFQWRAWFLQVVNRGQWILCVHNLNLCAVKLKRRSMQPNICSGLCWRLRSRQA